MSGKFSAGEHLPIKVLVLPFSIIEFIDIICEVGFLTNTHALVVEAVG